MLTFLKGFLVFLFGNHKIYPKVHNICKGDWGGGSLGLVKSMFGCGLGTDWIGGWVITKVV